MIGDLDYTDERYVRVYVRNTPEWLALSLEAQALLVLLRRVVDRAGILQLGRLGPRGTAVAIGHGHRWEVLEPALAELLEIGAVEIRGTVLLIPHFIDSEEARPGDRQRQQESRGRRADKARAENLGILVTDRDGPVTAGHSMGAVCDEESLRAVPSVPSVPSVPENPHVERPRKKPSRSAPSEAENATLAQVLARMNQLRGTDGHGFEKSPELLARIREGVPQEDLVLVVERKARALLEFKGGAYFRPSTLFGKENFAKYLDEVRAGSPSGDAFTSFEPQWKREGYASEEQFRYATRKELWRQAGYSSEAEWREEMVTNEDTGERGGA